MKNGRFGEAQRRRTNSVFLSRNYGFYLGTGFSTRLHAFHALQVCIAVEGSFNLRAGRSSKWERWQTAIIAADHVHQLNAKGTALAIFYFLPESAEARQIAENHLDHEVSTVPHRALETLLPSLCKYLEQGCDKEEAQSLCVETLGLLAPSISLRQRLDQRVSRAVEYLRSALNDHRITATEISRAAWASHSRLAHLFKAQTGVALRQYQRWLRVCTAIEHMATCKSLTEAAHEAGFADLAHLTHSFRQMLGVAPSILFHNSRIAIG
jgi:AraC family transcriptional regulator